MPVTDNDLIRLILLVLLNFVVSYRVWRKATNGARRSARSNGAVRLLAIVITGFQLLVISGALNGPRSTIDDVRFQLWLIIGLYIAALIVSWVVGGFTGHKTDDKTGVA